MNVMDLLFGELASFLSQAIIVVMVALMIVISLRLFLDRRKKGYMSMTISLIFVGIQYLLQLYVTFNDIHTSVSDYLQIMLKIISFVLINMGIYQLYNRTNRKQYIFFYGLIIMGFVVSALHFIVPNMYSGTEQQIRLLQDIGLELYVFVLIFLCFYMIPPYIGQQLKYQLALSIYFFFQTVHLLNTYMYENAQPMLTLAVNLLAHHLLFSLVYDSL